MSVERFRTLADQARARLQRLARNNVEVLTADGFDLPDELGTFDRIIVTAAMEEDSRRRCWIDHLATVASSCSRSGQGPRQQRHHAA